MEELSAGYALNRFEGLNNEPDMEVPWAYHYVGRPDRTAEVVHAALHNMFGLGRGGLPGNDDSGGLSSWYVWASLGLFPVAGQSLYLVNAPAFVQSRIDLNGAELSIETDGFVEPEPDGPAQYVQSVTFNGEPLDRTWLTARELHRGGTLVIALGPNPRTGVPRPAAVGLTRRLGLSRSSAPLPPTSPVDRRDPPKHSGTVPNSERNPMGAWMDPQPDDVDRRPPTGDRGRADPVICGHSGEARNLAEAALHRGFTEVRIVTWPLDLLEAVRAAAEAAGRRAALQRGHRGRAPRAGRRLQGARRAAPGRDDRPAGRAVHRRGADGVHVALPQPAHHRRDRCVRVARTTGLPVPVDTIAEAVGSDVTNVVRSCVADGRFGAAAQVLSAYLDSDVPVAVSEYTRELIISSADEIDAGTAPRSPSGAGSGSPISYPAINTADFLDLDPADDHRGWPRGPGAATATCCSCPGWPTPRGSTT